jgi:molybdate transport system substrate-binding protein
MHRIIVILSLVVAVLFATNCRAADTDALMLFCGAALKKPMDDIVTLYQEKTGVRVNVTYAGVGTLFSQILLSKQGDIFVAPSPDIMERAKRKGVVANKSIQNIAYIVPCINTQKGNPRKIRTLKDLTKPGIRVGLGNPEIVYVGALAQEIVTRNLSAVEKDALYTNVVTYGEDFNKLSTLLVLKQVDAIIGFHFLEGWYPDRIGTVKLSPAEVQRIGVAQAAVITYTSNNEAANKFVNWLTSNEVRTIFRKYHYFSAAREAFDWIGATKPVGGEFAVKRTGPGI